jgi:hypothetical protein
VAAVGHVLGSNGVRGSWGSVTVLVVDMVGVGSARWADRQVVAQQGGLMDRY